MTKVKFIELMMCKGTLYEILGDQAMELVHTVSTLWGRGIFKGGWRGAGGKGFFRVGGGVATYFLRYDFADVWPFLHKQPITFIGY